MAGTSRDARTLSRPQRRRRPGARARPRLRVVYPPELAADHALTAAEVIIGRSGEGGVELAHATVSRRHLLLERDGRGGYRARDLGSHNGSWIDGEPAPEPRPVRDQSVLRLGDVLCVLEHDGDGGDSDAVSREALPGAAAAIRALRAAIARVAADPSPVLLLGETGTGKERIAAELHRLSGRRGAFVAVNCAAISAQLAESHLFGHERGAFTGATAAQPGVFRAADGGSLFLDEIGELPLDQQPKLLRAIQEGEVHPVGAARAVRVDVRVITATHRDLTAAVGAGAFRRDVLARLAILELRVPALRERRADLLAWLDRLSLAWAARRRRPAVALRLDADAAERLLLAAWPDNLRGLERLVHELAGRGDELLGVDDLPPWLGASPPLAQPPQATSPRPPPPTRDELLAALEQHGFSIRATARHFARERRQIYRWMKAFGIESRSDD